MRPWPPTWLAGVNSATLPSSSNVAKPARLPTSRKLPGSSSPSMRSRQVSLRRLRWRTTPGSVEPGARRLWAIACRAVTLSSIGVQPSSAAAAGAALAAPAAGLITARIWLPSTASPTDRDANVATMPEQGAATEVSIFMALTTNSRSPAFTSAPSRALMSTIDPACGLSMASCPGGTGKGRAGGALAPRPRPRLATCWSRNCSAPVFALAGSIASASSVVRALPARNSGCARIARSWSPLVGTPTMWNSSSARRVRSTAESKQPEEPDWQISLASRGSNCGGGASPT